MPARLEREAQPPHVDVDGALPDRDMGAPRRVEQLRARIDPPGMGHQEVQQPELGRPEIDAALSCADPVSRRVEAQPGELDGVVGALRRPPAQHRLDPREQLARRERLGQVVVRADLQPGELVGFARSRGQHDDRDVAGAPVAAQAAREREARLAGQHPVEQHHVGKGFRHQTLGIPHARCAQRAMPGMLEVHRDQLADRGLVLDDQDGVAHLLPHHGA